MTLKQYGITVVEYNEMFEKQKGCCAVCGLPFGETPNVDHCHESGKVRGLLHTRCNHMLGHAKTIQRRYVRAPHIWNVFCLTQRTCRRIVRLQRAQSPR